MGGMGMMYGGYLGYGMMNGFGGGFTGLWMGIIAGIVSGTFALVYNWLLSRMN